jgi:hypothetical protein
MKRAQPRNKILPDYFQPPDLPAKWCEAVSATAVRAHVLH